MKWGLEQQIFAAVPLSKEKVLYLSKNSDGARDVKHLFLVLRDGCLPETCP